MTKFRKGKNWNDMSLKYMYTGMPRPYDEFVYNLGMSVIVNRLTYVGHHYA